MNAEQGPLDIAREVIGVIDRHERGEISSEEVFSLATHHPDATVTLARALVEAEARAGLAEDLAAGRQELLAKAQTDAACYICGGIPPASGKSCACGGTNRSRTALPVVLLRLHEVEERIKALETALARYGDHEADCEAQPSYESVLDEGGDCTCGWEALKPEGSA